MVGLRLLAAVLAVLVAICAPASAQGFETKAKQAYMVDAETGTLLYAKNADQPFPPASLAKLMTMELVFRAIRAGELKLQDRLVVSENAWRKGGAPSGGSTMFAAVKSSVPVEALIQGVIVQSANDGCIVLAEAMAGSEEAFAERMTKRARELGLAVSTFENATGLPAEGQVVTARELVQLAMHIWREYPEFYRFYAQPEFTWNKITQRNRNPLLRMEIGADGLKTGYTEESGYAIVGSISRNGRRLFLAMSGMASDKERADEAKRLLDWGLNGFERRELFAATEIVGQAQLFGGDSRALKLRANGPVAVLVPTDTSERLVARIVYRGPVAAPVREGTPIGSLRVWLGDRLLQETPLYAAETVGTGSLTQRAWDAVGELLTGWLRRV